VVGELGTLKSRRTLSLTPQMVEMLRRHRARQAAERMAVGEAWEDHGLIFPARSALRSTRTTSRTCSPGHWLPEWLPMTACGHPTILDGLQQRRID
jgi:integrase